MIGPTLLASLLETADPVICAIVRRKLRASLRSDDGREHNLDAMDLVGDIRLKLIRKLEEDAAAVDSVTSYAATVSYHTCADYLRGKYPERARLRNTLRRILERSPGHSVWQASNGEWLCGYAGWHARPQAAHSAFDHFVPAHRPDLHAPASLLRFLDEALEHAAGPATLDDLVELVGRHAGMEEVSYEALETGEDDTTDVLATMPSRQPGAESQWMARERMQLLWGAVLQLLPWHRAAYLLNLRDGELDAFPYYGVADVDQIRQSLDLKPSQLDRLAAACGVRLQAEDGLTFAACWNHLPVEDNVIAHVLTVTRAQVIAYRNKALERMRRSLSALRN